MTDRPPEELPDIDHDVPGDHPDEVTEEEAEEGRALYMAIDDLDDDWDGS
jgi:hypothetical protein